MLRKLSENFSLMAFSEKTEIESPTRVILAGVDLETEPEEPSSDTDATTTETTTTEAPSTENTTTEAPTTESATTEAPTTENTTTEAPQEETVDTQDSDTVTITVKRGMGSETVAKMLEEAGLIEDRNAYDLWLEQNGYARKIRVGTHTLKKGMTDEEIAIILTTEKED